MTAATAELVIKPRSGWQPIDFRELWEHRELLAFLIWRDVKIRYKQTALGGLWAILQPLIGMLVFATLFTRVAPIHTYGVPYPLFVFAGLVPWTFFANALALSSNSLLASEHLVRKIYLPRVLMPLAAILALIFDMVISLVFMAVLLGCYRWSVTPALTWLPAFVCGGFLATAGLGLTLSALNVRYRDVKYVVPFLTQMAFFVTPVIYPLRSVPSKFRIFVALNPMTGVVEGFRHALLGTPLLWDALWISVLVGAVLFVVGVYLFTRMERTFADVI
jgi:lipopolysaccharide transport system permease protein